MKEKFDGRRMVILSNYQQIEKLQSALNQSLQIQAMSEKKYEVEHQQLIEMKARSFWQKLTSVFE